MIYQYLVPSQRLTLNCGAYTIRGNDGTRMSEVTSKGNRSASMLVETNAAP